jgi:hypothetical protein
MKVRYCPGQSGGGLLARGNISPGGLLGKIGTERSGGCWQAASRRGLQATASNASVRRYMLGIFHLRFTPTSTWVARR